MSAALGWPPMPWQQLVADVAGEIEPSTGEWAYSTIIVEVQRQAGKTSLIAGTGTHRAITGQDRGIWYTAQKRQDARDNFMDLAKRLRRSPLGPHIRIRESNGSEGATFPTGSEYRVFSPVADALHGKATHLVTIDEGWSFDEARGDELMQAIIPTFSTTPGQLYIPSAAGDAGSQWFRGMVDTGRLFVESGRTDTIAYFSWGIGDDVDPADLGAVALAHPGYGYTLRPAGLIQAASTMKAGEFARAFGSRWTGAAERVIPGLLWLSAGRAGVALPGRFGVGFDVGLAGDDAAIAIAWRDPVSGRAHVEIADVRDGAAWLSGRLLQLVTDNDVAAVLFDRFGPAVAAADTATRAGLSPIESTSTEEYCTACAGFLGELVAGTLTYTPHPALDAAVEAAGKRQVGDRWAWGRRVSTSTIAPLVAATLALWAFDHAPQAPGPFVIR
jgi:phage terminase large subunit-like protein